MKNVIIYMCTVKTNVSTVKSCTYCNVLIYLRGNSIGMDDDDDGRRTMDDGRQTTHFKSFYILDTRNIGSCQNNNPTHAVPTYLV